MNMNHVLLILFGVLFIVVGAYAQSKSIILTKEPVIIVANNNSPKKIKLKWLNPDGSALFEREFNVITGEKVVIEPVN